MLELQQLVRIVPLENMQNMLIHHREIRTILRRKNSLGLQETTPTALRVMMVRIRLNNNRYAKVVLQALLQKVVIRSARNAKQGHLQPMQTTTRSMEVPSRVNSVRLDRLKPRLQRLYVTFVRRVAMPIQPDLLSVPFAPPVIKLR